MEGNMEENIIALRKLTKQYRKARDYTVSKKDGEGNKDHNNAMTRNRELSIKEKYQRTEETKATMRERRKKEENHNSKRVKLESTTRQKIK